MPEVVDSPATYGDKGDPQQGGAAIPSLANSVKDQEIVKSVWKGETRAKENKHAICKPNDWRRYQLLYNDYHWIDHREPWQATPTINMTFAAVNAILPVITDNRPQIAVIPREPDDNQIADILRAVIEWLWEDNNCDVLLPKTILNTLIFGNGFWKIIWDPTARQGLGDIRVINVDPVNVFVNPEATSFDDASEVYHVEQLPISYIEGQYPDKVGQLRGGVKDPSVIIHRPQMSQRDASKSGGVLDVATTTGTDVTTYSAGASSRTGPDTKDSCTVCQRWMKDRKTNRWRDTVVANDVLLKDELSEDNLVPMIHFMDYPIPWSFWGTGEIQHVESLQYEINRRRGMILDILMFCSSPMLVVDPASGIDIDSVVAMPGVTIPAEGGASAVSWLIPQMDLTGLFQLNDRDKQDFNDILGNVDVMRGVRPEGIEAGVALEYLGEAANTRMRLKVRLMEASLRRAGNILVKFIQKYYTTQRVFRIVGNEFSESGSPLPAAEGDFFSINQPVGVSDAGQPELENAIPPDAEFDVRIGAGSTLPVSKTSRFQQAITLFDRGALDEEELLKSSGWPRWEEVLSRIMAQRQAMAMGQMGGMEDMNPEASIPGSVEEITGPLQEEAPPAGLSM